jgi:CubicO group peptidase (beta-lactamase class C family)
MMLYIRHILFTGSKILLILMSGKSQTSFSLPRSTPETEMVSSAAILTFLDSAAALKGLELHSFMFLRHGKVIAEGSWNPYKPSLVHTMNSCTKVFCSTAMGFAISVNRLTLGDKVISFFPNDLPDTMMPMHIG